MVNITALFPFASFLPWAVGAAATASVHNFNVTASSAVNGQSIVQCWQLSQSITASIDNKYNYAAQFFGNISGGSYALFPAGTQFGLHPAPAKQWVIIQSGSIKVTSPSNNYTGYINAGLNGLLFADDTSDKTVLGHFTEALEQLILVQLPTAGGTVPPHTVLHNGPCQGPELLT